MYETNLGKLVWCCFGCLSVFYGVYMHINVCTYELLDTALSGVIKNNFLFLIQNIYCGYSKNYLYETVLLSTNINVLISTK